MSISTGGGDQGQTGLYSGQRISKADLRVECYGTVDELNSWLGYCRQAAGTGITGERLLAVQRDLFRVAGELATVDGPYADPLPESAPEGLAEIIHQLEREIRLTGFVIPGNCEASARLDIARTVCRRAERAAVRLADQACVPLHLIRYLNRLSDLLFLLGRQEEQATGAILKKNDL